MLFRWFLDDIILNFLADLKNTETQNIDYILMLVQRYHDSNCQDKEILVTIEKSVDASPELRSKKEVTIHHPQRHLISPFIARRMASKGFTPCFLAVPI